MTELEAMVEGLGAVQRERDERWDEFVTQTVQHRSEMVTALTDLARRVETLEVAALQADSANQTVTRSELASALALLKLDIAGIARQAAADERQARAAYIELVGQIERMKITVAHAVPDPARHG